MNIYDISQKAGVSIATVSRVINNSPSVSEKTKRKVLDVIESSDYTPNAFARGLGLNTMRTIGILCADSSDIYLAQAVYYLERELLKQGYNCILCCTGYELENKQHCMKLLLTKQTDAIILVGSNFVEQKADNIRYIIDAARQVPVMLLNGYLDADNIYSILCDDYQAIYDSVTFLLDQGKKDILYLYRALTYSGNQKMAGYKDAYGKQGRLVQEEMMCQCTGNPYAAKGLLLKLDSQNIKFDAIVASDDILAVGAVKYAKEKGIHIPRDLSIIGYNNSILGTCCDPELSSVDNKVEALCMTTSTTLMSVFEGKNIPSKTVISANLIKRGTTE